MSHSRTAHEAVIIAILQDDKVLLHKRKNTGWMAGWYDVPSGHVNPGEAISDAAIREAYEEAGISINSSDLQLVHISQADTDKTYTYFIFKVEKWTGKPKLNEPELAEALEFYELDNLPDHIPLYTKAGLQSLGSKEVTFSYFDADKF